MTGLGQVSSTAHERERAETDRGRLRRRGYGRRAVAAGDEANKALDPGRAAEARGHVAQAMPQTGACAQEERADGRRAERELLGELPVAEPADLAQQESLALGPRHLPDLLPDSRELSCAQDLRRGVRRRSVRQVAGRHGSSRPLSEAGVALVTCDREQPRKRLSRRRAVQERAVRGEENLLRRVLGFRSVAQERPAEPRDRGPVLEVEGLGVVRPAVVLECGWPHGDGHVYVDSAASDCRSTPNWGWARLRTCPSKSSRRWEPTSKGRSSM